MARVSSIEFAVTALSGANARNTADFDVAVIYERQIDIAAGILPAAAPLPVNSSIF